MLRPQLDLRNPAPTATDRADELLQAAAIREQLQDQLPVAVTAEAPVTQVYPESLQSRLQREPESLDYRLDLVEQSSTPTRYAGLYELFNGIDGFKRTMTEVPLGGVVRALAENAGVDYAKARLLERGSAGLLSAGVGASAILAAIDGLNGEERPNVVVMQR